MDGHTSASCPDPVHLPLALTDPFLGSSQCVFLTVPNTTAILTAPIRTEQQEELRHPAIFKDIKASEAITMAPYNSSPKFPKSKPSPFPDPWLPLCPHPIAAQHYDPAILPSSQSFILPTMLFTSFSQRSYTVRPL